MQADEVEFELTPGMLDTPSLMTPNIVLNAPPIKSTYNPIHINGSSNHENNSTSDPSDTTAESSPSVTSADVKVSRIEDELKQSLSEPRRPTPSPFQKISSSSNVFDFHKPNQVVTTDDGTIVEIPSTADVVKELEALTNINPLQFQTKTFINDSNERDTSTTITNAENIRYDSPPTLNMGVIVSPKKQFLIRSQSHTEPTSPIQINNNHLSQSQKSNHDNSSLNTQNDLVDETSLDDSVNIQFVRVIDLPTITQLSDASMNNNQQLKAIVDNGNEQHLNIQLRPDQNGIPHSIVKQQPTVFSNNKRTFQQANTGNHISPITKANTIVIPQASLNEVTSTDQLSTVKRQKTTPLPINTPVMNFRPSHPTPSSSATNTLTLTTNGGSDDPRKKQIRDSNREAARRCRERRRQYIEQLEGTLDQHKTQIKQLSEKLTRIERENTQLRAILSETKILHPSSRHSSNESHVDYVNVVTATEMDLNPESTHQTDGGTIQRNYITRNNL